jgi:tetratricopeptide (TPR) repeat protein
MILPAGANQPHRIKAEWPVSSKSQGGSGRNTGSATIIPLPLPGDEAGRVEAGIEGLALHLTNALIELASIAEAHRVDISDAARLAAELLNVGVMGLTVSQQGTIEAVNAIGDGHVRRRQFLNSLTAVGGVALSARLERHVRLRQPSPEGASGDEAASITAITGYYRRLEAMTPTDQLRDPALGHLRFAARLADDASSSTLRTRLAAAASETSGFAGWLALDLGDHTAARHHYNEAIKRAHQAERPVLAAYMLGSMSLWAAELGNGNEAVALSEQAYGLLPASGRTPPAAEVWMALVDATARASRHDAKATQHALGRAEDLAECAHDAHQPVWPWVYPIDQAKIASYRGACYTKLKLPTRAIPALQHALDVPAGAPASKHHGLQVCDLATSHLLAREVEEACRLAAVALAIGRDRSSPRVIHRVRDFRAQLDPRRHGDCVRQLDEHLVDVVLNP